MATFTSVLLSGSTNGRNIKVTATATPGTLIHTAHASNTDEVTLRASNTSTADVKLTLEVGGVTSPDDLVEITIPAEMGEFEVLKRRLTGGVVVRAFAGTANVINIGGEVNRIS